MGRRLADQFPIWPAAHAAGLQNTRAIWADAELKRKMDRLVQARALGVEDALSEGNDEMPGDINIQGDKTEYHTHYHQPQQPPTVTTQTQPAATAPTAAPKRRGLLGFVVPALIGAGSLGAGALGMALYNYVTDKPESVTTITQPSSGSFEYRYGIEQKPTPQGQ